MSKRTRLLGFGAAALLAAGIGTYAFTASSEEGEHDFGPRSAHPMGQAMMGHGMMRQGMMHGGMMHGGMMRGGMMGGGMMGGRDSAVGKDMSAIHALAADHDRITRTVTNLPDGIRTVTESDDPHIARLIKEHVASMGERVRSGKMLGVPIESPAVHAIYANKDKIRTTAEPTEKGVIVVQTSTDPKIIALLQEHAVEVSDLVRGGMAAMHAAMTRNHGGGMRGGMMTGMHERMMRGGPHGGMRHDH